MSKNFSDHEAIRNTVQLYIDGCAQGNGDIMRPAFYESATINGAPIETLFVGADEAGPTDSTATIDILDIENDIAVVRINLKNYHGEDYVDYHVLKKDEEGTWKILAKAFT